MSWLDIHRKRLANEGASIREGYSIQTANLINAKFDYSPTFIQVLIDGEEYDARFVTEKAYSASSGIEIKKLIFRPYTRIPRGKYVQVDGRMWLIIYFDDNDMYPKAQIRFCNNVLKFKNGNEYPCILDNKIQSSSKVDEETYVNLPSDRMKVTVAYNEDTKNIKELDRFVFNGLAWEVQGFDRIVNVYDEEGIIEFAVKKVPLKEDEKEEPTNPPIIPKDYYIEIIGVDEVEINQSTTFVANVYVDGSLIPSVIIDWSTDKGTINTDGEFVAPSDTGMATIIAQYQYIDEEGITQTIRAEKQIEIFDNDDWGWW